MPSYCRAPPRSARIYTCVVVLPVTTPFAYCVPSPATRHFATLDRSGYFCVRAPPHVISIPPYAPPHTCLRLTPLPPHYAHACMPTRCARALPRMVIIISTFTRSCYAPLVTSTHAVGLPVCAPLLLRYASCRLQHAQHAFFVYGVFVFHFSFLFLCGQFYLFYLCLFRIWTFLAFYFYFILVPFFLQFVFLLLPALFLFAFCIFLHAFLLFAFYACMLYGSCWHSGAGLPLCPQALEAFLLSLCSFLSMFQCLFCVDGAGAMSMCVKLDRLLISFYSSLPLSPLSRHPFSSQISISCVPCTLCVCLHVCAFLCMHALALHRMPGWLFVFVCLHLCCFVCICLLL